MFFFKFGSICYTYCEQKRCKKLFLVGKLVNITPLSEYYL